MKVYSKQNKAQGAAVVLGDQTKAQRGKETSPSHIADKWLNPTFHLGSLASKPSLLPMKPVASVRILLTTVKNVFCLQMVKRVQISKSQRKAVLGLTQRYKDIRTVH